MKIAIVNDLLGDGSNGTFVATYNLIQHLKQRGHEVRLICADQRKKDDPDCFVLPARRFGAPIDRYIKKVGVTFPRLDEELMDRALDGVEYIHCITPFTLSKYALKYAKAHDIPISAGFHIMAENITAYFRLFGMKRLNNFIYRRLYKTFYGALDGIHYPTQFIRTHFELRVNTETPGYVISNGAERIFYKRETEKPHSLDGKMFVTSIGRYSREKAQEVLIKAVGASKHKDNIVLVLAGHGAREKYYRRLAQRLNVRAAFEVFDRGEVAELLNCTDIYVHTAIIELEGIACIEALKCGVPTLVSDAPLSATYDFAADSGCVFEDEDSGMLGSMIDELIENEERREQLSKAALSSSVKYVNECMLEMDDMINDVVEKKRARDGAAPL